jgi:hypothetical protein
MVSQDVVATVLRKQMNQSGLWEIFTKNSTHFTEVMLRANIPLMISAAHGKVRHPYLESTEMELVKLNDPDNNSKPKVVYQKTKVLNDPTLNVIDAMYQIAENTSLADIYETSGGWKKNELYPYYMYHSRIIPCLFAKLPDRDNRNPISVNWTETTNLLGQEKKLKMKVLFSLM